MPRPNALSLSQHEYTMYSATILLGGLITDYNVARVAGAHPRKLAELKKRALAARVAFNNACAQVMLNLVQL